MRRSEVRFLMGTQNFSVSHACDKTKKHLLSSYSFTLESHVKVMRIEKMIIK